MAEAAANSDSIRRQRAEQLAQTLPPLMVQAERVASTVAQGVHGRRRVGAGETFWQFRRYQSGDAAQQIDWRQSAKTQKLFVRENEWEAAQSVWLWRDGSPSMHYQSRMAETAKLERSSLLALALASVLVRGGERVALLGTGERPISGRAAVTRLADHLAQSDREKPGDTAPSLPPQERLPRFGQVVLISDFLLPLDRLEELIMGFAGAGVNGHLLQVLDPAEEDLPFRGRTRFEGMERDGDVIVGRAESLQEEFQEYMSVRRERLIHIARRIGWSAAVHRTDRPPQTALLALYRAISAEGAGSAW